MSNGLDNLLGNLAGLTDFIEAEKLKIVEQHLAQFEEFPGEFPQNRAMLNRLNTALIEGRQISGADLSFYYHELKEAELMTKGLSYKEAHTAALQFYRVSPFSLYHPEVIQQFPDEFNKNWLNAWRIEK
ncbi:hypothetical protein [Laspinema olomoucense]|uniref:hypothetical protein n=1 Tax=Laspinema olomoucense TaxID=3231600 RepID=UPI0021BB386A|nr:hypothetical protein [Laspinema sp. D3c]MCT7994828.1 hypothetical protein [Laspinema sp. D3c]